MGRTEGLVHRVVFLGVQVVNIPEVVNPQVWSNLLIGLVYMLFQIKYDREATGGTE